MNQNDGFSYVENKVITQEELKAHLEYSPDTGEFKWLSTGTGRRPNLIAGTIWGDGYIGIRILNIRYAAHRLAWLYMTGDFPENQIDHINHVRSDNRFCNLRLASNQDNQKNCTIAKNNSSGFTGVHFDRTRKKWKVEVMVDGVSKHLGRFSSLSDAVSARADANIKHGFHENHGRNEV